MNRTIVRPLVASEVRLGIAVLAHIYVIGVAVIM